MDRNNCFLCNIDLNRNINNSEFEYFKENLIYYYQKEYLSHENEEEIEFKNILITLSTTKNQKEYILNNKNKTSIVLLECENKLKAKYNIPINDTLFISKYDIKEEGMKIPKIEYEIF